MRHELDLHNVRHGDVGRALDQFLAWHLAAGTPEVEIITGNSDPMRDAVSQALLDYDIRAERSIVNPGKMVARLLA